MACWHLVCMKTCLYTAIGCFAEAKNIACLWHVDTNFHPILSRAQQLGAELHHRIDTAQAFIEGSLPVGLELQ